MDTKNKDIRFTDLEFALAKSAFAENDDMLKLVRKVMLQSKLSSTDIIKVKNVFSKDLIAFVSKFILPTVDVDAPLSLVIDLWMTFETQNKTPAEVSLAIKTRGRLISMLKKGLARLESPTVKGEFEVETFEPEFESEEEDYISLISRNSLITHIDQQLVQLKLLAGYKKETPEQTKERLFKNSSK